MKIYSSLLQQVMGIILGRAFYSGKTFWFSLLGVLIVAAFTLEIHVIRLLGEQMEDMPWDGNMDLDGIGFMTALTPRGDEIAV